MQDHVTGHAVRPCVLCGQPAPHIDCGWSGCARYCSECTDLMDVEATVAPGVDLLSCHLCGRTTVAHQGLLAPCDSCSFPELASYIGHLHDQGCADVLKSGWHLFGNRTHVGTWGLHEECGVVQRGLMRCLTCEGPPSRSMAAQAAKPGHLYLLEWRQGRSGYLKVGIALQDGSRVSQQLGAGAILLDRMDGPYGACRSVEQSILRSPALTSWRVRPSIPLDFGGDTECFRSGAPIGRLYEWAPIGNGLRTASRRLLNG